MRPRVLGRRLAMQYLYIDDANRGDCEAPSDFVRAHTDQPEARAFAEALIAAARQHRERVDELLRRNLRNFVLERVARVERSVLRLGTSELLGLETPPRVVLNEAVELARTFGGPDSPAFVNGVLDGVLKDLSRSGAAGSATAGAPPEESP
jgi:N utilization substance protein B